MTVKSICQSFLGSMPLACLALSNGDTVASFECYFSGDMHMILLVWLWSPLHLGSLLLQEASCESFFSTVS